MNGCCLWWAEMMNAERGRRRDSGSIQTFLYVMLYIWLTLKYGYTFIQNTLLLGCIINDRAFDA